MTSFVDDALATFIAPQLRYQFADRDADGDYVDFTYQQSGSSTTQSLTGILSNVRVEKREDSDGFGESLVELCTLTVLSSEVTTPQVHAEVTLTTGGDKWTVAGLNQNENDFVTLDLERHYIADRARGQRGGS